MIALLFFLSLYLGINIRYSIALGIIEAILLIIFIFYRFKWKIALISLSIIIAGFGISFIKPSFNSNSYQSLVIESKENYFIASCRLEKFYVYEKSNEYEIGDILLITGNKKDLDFTHVESDFDFKEYLENKGVYSELVPTEISIKFSNPIKIKRVRAEFLSHFDQETASIVSLLLFGSNIESDTNNLFREAHLIRLISNSGIFLYLIYKSLLFILSKFLNEKWSEIIGISLFSIYGIFTFPRFVVIRFISLKVIQMINKYLLKRRYSYLDLISVLGIFFLLFDYHLAYQDSFCLSFLIPIFVLFYNASFTRIKKIKKKLLLTLFVSIVFVPFTLKYNNEISILSLPFQLIITPFTSVYGVMSFLCFLRIPLYAALNGFTLFLNKFITVVSPFLIKVYAPPFTQLGTLIYEMGFISILYFLSIGLKDIYKYLIPIFSFSFALYLLPIYRWIIPKITFLNVGQGDSCLISYKNYNILIDTGGSNYKDYGKDCLIPYFKKNRIYDIDLLITTHDDIDHSGAVDSLINNFKIKQYVTSYENFPISIGNITIQNLNNFTEYWSEDNDKSLILYFNIGSTSFLITGDAPKKIEEKIVDSYPKFHVDILKIGHHGSNTSSSDKFIEFLSPKEAVISCGKNNKYGHPHIETIQVLEKFNVKIRRTDIEGSIIYTLKPTI